MITSEPSLKRENKRKVPKEKLSATKQHLQSLMRHFDHPSDLVSASKMNKKKENEIQDFVSDGMVRIGIQTLAGDVQRQIERERNRKPPKMRRKQPNPEIHLYEEDELNAFDLEQFMHSEPENKQLLDADEACICELDRLAKDQFNYGQNSYRSINSGAGSRKQAQKGDYIGVKNRYGSMGPLMIRSDA